MGKIIYCVKNHQRLFDVQEDSNLNIRFKCSNKKCKFKATCNKKEIVKIGTFKNSETIEYLPHRCPECGIIAFEATSNSCGLVEIKCTRCKKIVNIKIGNFQKPAYAA